MSERDIRAGARWNRELVKELEASDVGIICLTPENLAEPWLNFESGALAKHLDTTPPCTYLIDLQPADVAGPLADFQHSIADRDGTLKVLTSINDAQEKVMAPDRLGDAFGKWWPELESCLQSLPSANGPGQPKRSGDDMTAEVLQVVRELSRKVDMIPNSVWSLATSADPQPAPN
jgi:hypothetical protein